MVRHPKFDTTTRHDGTGDGLCDEHRYFYRQIFFTYEKTFCFVRETISVQSWKMSRMLVVT
jgi:hypothetical protein